MNCMRPPLGNSMWPPLGNAICVGVRGQSNRSAKNKTDPDGLTMSGSLG